MKHPMQPIILDDEGTPRFKQNPIVRFLLDAGPFDLNQLAILPGTTPDDHAQFAQLTGYSVSGFGDLSYADPETVAKADEEAGLLLGEEIPLVQRRIKVKQTRRVKKTKEGGMMLVSR